MPIALITQVAGPIALAAAAIGWIIDITCGVTTRLYREHFETQRDLAEALFESEHIRAEDALEMYFPAILELIVAQSPSLFAPRLAKRRLKARLWVVEHVLPLVRQSSTYVQPATFYDWVSLVEDLTDAYTAAAGKLSFFARISPDKTRMARSVVAEWEQNCHQRGFVLRTLKPQRTVALVPAPNPILDVIATTEDAVPVKLLR